MRKINEICGQESNAEADGDAGQEGAPKVEPYININEMELNLATKGRAASMDVRRGRE